MFAVAILAGRRAGKRRPGSMIRLGFAARAPSGCSCSSRSSPGPTSGWRARHPPGDRRLRAGPAGLAAQQLHAGPIEEERVSEAAGVNSAAGSFGLSFGLAVAGGLMLAALSLEFTSMTD